MSRRLLPILLLAVSGVAPAAEPALFPDAPLAAPARAPAGAMLLRLAAARSALALGFPSVAAALDEELLAAAETPAADRNALVLDLVSARLNEGQLAEAGQALQRYTGRPDAAYRLRAGLIAVRSKRLDLARAAVAAIRPEELPAGDRGWLYLLQGALADATGDFTRAGEAYQQAMDLAGSDLQRAQFKLARGLAELRAGGVSEPGAATLRQSADRLQGRPEGYGSALQYAVAWAALGHTGEAVGYLQKQLQALPVAERATSDSFRLELGLIAGARDGVGRNALESLLADADSRDCQRVALQLLANAAGDEAARAEFRGQLDRLINSPVQHPILEDLLQFRAQLGLAEKNYAGAEADATQLLERFPGSQLKSDALTVLTGVAWEKHNYRTAAARAAEARAALPPGDMHSRLGVLAAEGDFRHGDFQNAVAAYEAALEEPPPDVAAGNLMFQLVCSEISAGRLPEAGRRIDDLARDSRFDALNRWQAEWNLARALQAAGQTGTALARVDRLLQESGPATADQADLRIRLVWLQAQLTFEAGDYERTITLAQALPEREAAPAAAGAALGREVAAGTRLLQARANFQLDRPDQAVALLKQLREDFTPATPSASPPEAVVYSYIAEADYDAGKGRLVDAQQLLIKLADEFKGHPYAPYALYLAAGNAERRGLDKTYNEAYALLGRLVTDYPQSDLVFYARLKQGDLQRRLNDFGSALQTYKFLTDNFAQHADVLTAELALADCHRALMSSDSSHYESALSILERLQDLKPPPAPAPVDLYVEACYKLGDLLAGHGTPESLVKAQKVWWTLVTGLLLDETQAARLGPTGRSWMARTLLHFGDSLVQQNRLGEAGDAYRLLLAKQLPSASVASAKLADVGGKP